MFIPDDSTRLLVVVCIIFTIVLVSIVFGERDE